MSQGFVVESRRRARIVWFMVVHVRGIVVASDRLTLHGCMGWDCMHDACRTPCATRGWDGFCSLPVSEFRRLRHGEDECILIGHV